MEESLQPLSRGELPRGEVMQTPDEVAAILRLKRLGWGIKRIAREIVLNGSTPISRPPHSAEISSIAYRGGVSLLAARL
jgi:hypothetical protein